MCQNTCPCTQLTLSMLRFPLLSPHDDYNMKRTTVKWQQFGLTILANLATAPLGTRMTGTKGSGFCTQAAVDAISAATNAPTR